MNEVGELEMLENLAGGGGEGLDVGFEVPGGVGFAELPEIHRRCVVEEVLRLAQQEFLLRLHGHRGDRRGLRQHRGLGGHQNALQAAQQGEGQDDAAVLGLLEVAAEQVGDGPDFIGGGGKVGRHGGDGPHAERNLMGGPS